MRGSTAGGPGACQGKRRQPFTYDSPGTPARSTRSRSGGKVTKTRLPIPLFAPSNRLPARCRVSGVLDLRHAPTFMATAGAMTTYLLGTSRGGPTCTVSVPSCTVVDTLVEGNKRTSFSPTIHRPSLPTHPTTGRTNRRNKEQKNRTVFDLASQPQHATRNKANALRVLARGRSWLAQWRAAVGRCRRRWRRAGWCGGGAFGMLWVPVYTVMEGTDMNVSRVRRRG